MLIVRPTIRFVGLDIHESDGGADVRFEIKDERSEVVGYLVSDTPPTDFGNLDRLLAVAHRNMAAVARSWAKELDEMAAHYEQI